MQLGLYNDFENMPEQRLRTTAVQHQGATFGLRNRLNEDLRRNNHVSAAPRSFGLQSRISSFKGNIKDVEEVKGNMSTFSRTFGLISDDLGSSVQNSERFHHELRRNDYSENRSLISRPFGLQTRNLSSHLHAVTEDNLRANEHPDVMNNRSNINTLSVSRPLDLRSENINGLNSHDNERLNNDLRRNNYINSSLMLRSNGFQSRNLTVNSGLLSEGGPRFNQDFPRSNGVSAFRTFGPMARSSTVTTRQDGESYDIINGGFKRPLMSRVIRGRNSTLSSRLFHSESINRHSKDLSNINGFNVSHISQRNVETLSGSRFGLSSRSNCMDNQSISQSVISGASIKAKLINLLENLHYSILSMAPHATPEAVRLEFDKAKQNLESISEMSFAPSFCNGDAASVISQSSKTLCPTVSQPITTETLDGGLLHLKSSEEMLQSLMSSRGGVNKSRIKNASSVQKGRKGAVVSSAVHKESDEEENSELVFKKPRAFPKRRASKATKVQTPRRVKSPPKRSASKAVSKVVNLKQWYPIAVGSDLAFCGVDEQGATVRTDPVKKRVNNRRVELINGLACNLLGSPSTMISILPKKVLSLLKNGLTDRWRVLQKELLNCQTAEKDTKKRISSSPKVTSSPKKKGRKSSKAQLDKGKPTNLKCRSTPVEDVAEMQTRSGRTIKPPRMFWLVADTGSDEVTSTSRRATPEIREESPGKKSRKGIEETPVRKMKSVGSSSWRAKQPRGVSRGRKKKTVDDTPETTKQAEKKSPETKGVQAKGNRKKEREQEVKVDSSTEHVKKQSKSRLSGSKRKREVTGDLDAVLPKRSKLEKRTELETTEQSINCKKKKTTTSSPRKRSPAKKKKETIKKKVGKNSSEGEKETREITESEEDFELKLDDIEIPEIGNVSGNYQLNRSQLRLISMETPPLRYFSSNLKVLGSATPVRSPDWCLSQRTESEVKQFQRRREEAFKKRIKVDVKEAVITEHKNVQSKDVKRVMEWVADKTVRSPQWNSKVLQYIIPSRRKMEQQAEEEDEEDIETEFL